MIKSSFFWRILTSSAIVLGVTTTINPPTIAGGNTYYCAQLNGVYRTFVNTTRGRIALINWVNSYSERWTARNRCIEVSQRFQRFLENGTLKYIRTGIINNQPVICVANQRGGDCPSNQVLITLTPDVNPEEFLLAMFGIIHSSNSSRDSSNSSRNGGYYPNRYSLFNRLTNTRGGNTIEADSNGVSINIDQWLNSLPVEENTPVPVNTGENIISLEPSNSASLPLIYQGVLEEGDNQLSSNNSLYDTYTFVGNEGQLVTIEIESKEFSPSLSLFLVDPQQKKIVENSNISSSNINYRITVELPVTGRYVVLVSSIDGDDKGIYTFTLNVVTENNSNPQVP